MSSSLDLLKRFSRGNISPPRDDASRLFRLLIFPVFLSLYTILISCSGAVSGPAPAVTVSVAPGSAQPFAGTNIQFTATVQNATTTAVSWMVNKVPGGNSTVGTINSTGLYAAPVSVPSPATVTITAAWESDSTRSGSSNVTILALSSIQGPLTLSPALSSVTTSQTLQLQVVTAGLSPTLLNWSVDGVPGGNVSNGTITGAGLYSPPSVAGAHLIIGSLQANASAIGSAQVEVTTFPGTFTWRNDNSRSGINQQEMALAPSTVNSGTFGKLFSCPLDGYAYAQPLYVANLAIPGNGTHNVVFVATEMDSVFAFDADANPCVQLWKKSLVPAGSEVIPTPNLDITSSDIAPFLGITGTPVINISNSVLYVVAKTRTVGSNSQYSQLLYALDLATGQPKIIPAGAQIGSAAAVSPGFSPLLENQRAALLLDNGTVYVAFGSHGGQGNYHGWLLAFSATTLQQTAFFDITSDSLLGGGIWQSGGGPSSDANHNVFVLTGDGPFDANRGGISYSDSFLRIGTSSGLALADYFTPCNQVALASSGTDVGASAPLLLPDSAGFGSEPHLMIGASKNGSLYLANRDNLGGFNGQCPDAPARVQSIAVGDGPILSTPLFWNNSVYVAAGNGKLKAFPLAAGVLASSPLVSQSPEMFGVQGATPVVSSKGAANGLIWLIDASGAQTAPNTPAILRVFDPNNLSNEIYNSTMQPSRDTAGLAVKFSMPTVGNAKAYLATQTELDVYGLLH